MKLVLISDTHSLHTRIQLPPGDILIHAGDVSRSGGKQAIEEFIDWFAETPYQTKIFIAGNHDFYFERPAAKQLLLNLPPDVIYLQDSGVVLDGLHFWGSPIQPWFYDWAFNRHQGADIQRHWNLIPANTDILITHGPVYGILDKTVRGDLVGCPQLLSKVQEIQPQLHICGHIHEAYGTIQQGKTTYVNASILDVKYNIVNRPVVVDVDTITKAVQILNY